jgi:hypothetical protein
MPRQNSVKISKQGENNILCEVYSENDADKRTIKDATYHDLKMAAKACNCLTCAGILENIKNAILWRLESYVSKKMEIEKNKSARENRRYFIKQLRENMASPNLKHNFTPQGV